MSYVALFFVGVLLCNSIPHLTCGLAGFPHPTPFAKPRGVGLSSPLLNFIWGTVNLVFGLFLLSRHPVVLGANPECLVILIGALLIGLYLAVHFGKVRRGA